MDKPIKMKVGSFLTDREIEGALFLIDDIDQLEEQFIKPNIERINEITGQDNNSRYLAYAVQYALRNAERYDA